MLKTFPRTPKHALRVKAMGIGPSGAIGVFKTCETCSLSESPVLSPMPIIGASDYPVVLSFPTGSKVYSVFALSLGIGPSGQES